MNNVKINRNAMQFKFEKLIIWQKAMELGEEINLLSEKFPKKELFNLSSQILWALGSIWQCIPAS